MGNLIISNMNRFSNVFKRIHNIYEKKEKDEIHKIAEKINNLTSKSDTKKINRLQSELRKYQANQKNIEKGVSMLQKNYDEIKPLNDMSKRLKELSKQYKNNSLSDDDKKNIENESEKIIEDINKILTNNFSVNAVVNSEKVAIESIGGSNLVIGKKFLSISIDSGKDKIADNAEKIKKNKGPKDISVEGNLSIEEILSDPDRIQSNLIQPLNSYNDDILNQESELAEISMHENTYINLYAESLVALNAIDDYTKDRFIRESSVIIENASNAIKSQVKGLNRENVRELLS